MAVMATSDVPARRRSSRALELDGILQQVAIEQIATMGWDAVSARSITASAGVTIGAFYARFISKAELARQLWEQVLADHLLGALGRVIEAAHDPDGLIEAIAPFTAGSPELVAAFELVLASQWGEPLRRGVGEPAAEVLAAWFDPEAHGPVGAAVRVAAVGLAIGLLIRSGRPWTDAIDLGSELERHAAVFADPGDPVDLDPTIDEGSPLRVRQFNGTDGSTARLLMAMVETVATMGYRRATLSHTCASIGVTTGFLFARYDTKLDLMVAAVEATWSQSTVQSQSLALDLAGRFDLGIVEAALWREFLHPDLGDLRRFLMEVERLARMEPTLMAAIAERETEAARQVAGATSPWDAPPSVEVGMALGIGLPAVALLVPSIWTLPFSALTVGLMASEPEVEGGLWGERAGRRGPGVG